MRNENLKRFWEKFVAVAAIATWSCKRAMFRFAAERFGIYAVMMYRTERCMLLLYCTERSDWKGDRDGVIRHHLSIRNKPPNILLHCREKKHKVEMVGVVVEFYE
jgi:hypothetical protein